MDYLVEFYDDWGRCFHKFRAEDVIEALRLTAVQCSNWRGLGFRNASCYYKGNEEWNIEIK